MLDQIDLKIPGRDCERKSIDIETYIWFCFQGTKTMKLNGALFINMNGYMGTIKRRLISNEIFPSAYTVLN